MIDLDRLFSHQTALAAIERAERLVWRDGGDELDEIPGPPGFLGCLYLNQIEIVHHALILTDPAIWGVSVRDRRGLHLRHEEQRKRLREMRLSAAARGVRVPDPSVPPLNCPWLDGVIARE